MTSMLLRICTCACSDMGSTAPTNLPDSISCREGMPSLANFSSSLRKLAKGDLLLLESFSAPTHDFLNQDGPLPVLLLEESIAHRFPLSRDLLSYCITDSLLMTCGGSREWGSGAEIRKRSFVYKRCIASQPEITMLGIHKARIGSNVRLRLEFWRQGRR